VQIELGGLHHAVGGEQPAHQLLQAIRLGDDHLGVFAQLGVIQLPLEQLGRAADAAEGFLISWARLRTSSRLACC
jgi:hypothetical protein